MSGGRDIGRGRTPAATLLLADPVAGVAWRRVINTAAGRPHGVPLVENQKSPASHYKIAPPRKVSPDRQFTGKNPPRPAAARAGRIFTGKLSAGADFSGGGGIL